jgi:hypothetical protein
MFPSVRCFCAVLTVRIFRQAVGHCKARCPAADNDVIVAFVELRNGSLDLRILSQDWSSFDCRVQKRCDEKYGAEQQAGSPRHCGNGERSLTGSGFNKPKRQLLEKALHHKSCMDVPDFVCLNLPSATPRPELQARNMEQNWTMVIDALK